MSVPCLSVISLMSCYVLLVVWCWVVVLDIFVLYAAFFSYDLLNEARYTFYFLISLTDARDLAFPSADADPQCD